MEKSELPSVKKIIRNGSFSFLLLIFLTTCYYDNEENLYPQLAGSCDTTNVTYTLTVKPVLQAYCLSCHSTNASAGSGGGIKMEAYSDLKALVTSGKFYGSITHATGYSAMPKGGSILDNCTVQKLKKWIDDGAPNN
jgi:hypothetical protein